MSSIGDESKCHTSHPTEQGVWCQLRLGHSGPHAAGKPRWTVHDGSPRWWDEHDGAPPKPLIMWQEGDDGSITSESMRPCTGSYGECPCVLPAGHKGDHQCVHDGSVSSGIDHLADSIERMGTKRVQLIAHGATRELALEALGEASPIGFDVVVTEEVGSDDTGVQITAECAPTDRLTAAEGALDRERYLFEVEAERDRYKRAVEGFGELLKLAGFKMVEVEQ